MEFLIKYLTIFDEYAKDDTIVLVNVASIVDDVNILKDIYEQKGLSFSGDYAQVYKYLRSTTMSPNQLESLTGKSYFMKMFRRAIERRFAETNLVHSFGFHIRKKIFNRLV